MIERKKERLGRSFSKNAGLFFLMLITVPCLFAQDHEDLDAYKLRLDGFWFYSQPSGSFHGNTSQGNFDLQKDAQFNSYNTGYGKIDWKFTHKNHLYFGALPINQSKQVVLDRTVVFQGQTFNAGLTASGRLENYLFTPGYQYDFFRRKQWHLGVAAQLDLFYIKGTLQAAAQVSNGTSFAGAVSSSTLRAPLPVAGPEFRVYPIHNSNRLFIAGNVLGMYFFGYGNFVSSVGIIGVSANKHLNFQGGYQLGSRIDIKSTNDRIGLNLTQRGAVAGLEVSF
jgi:hypothetical protein